MQVKAEVMGATQLIKKRREEVTSEDRELHKVGIQIEEKPSCGVNCGQESTGFLSWMTLT